VSAASSSEDGSLRVILVDDVADIRLLLRMTLEDDPRFEIVGEAANGLEAVEQAAELHPDVMLLDLMMPVMSGLEAIPLINDRAPATKVIAYSGSDKEIGQHAVSLGAVAFLEKGAPSYEIIDAILTVGAP
jgi:DNA-binding NarL/FixJ family response regulator